MANYLKKERMLAAFHFERPDRVPCFLNNALSTSRVVGLKIGEMVTNSDKFSNALVTAYEKFDYDAVRVTSDVAVEAEAMGGIAVYPADAAVSLKKHPIQTEADIDHLKMPDPNSDGRMPLMLDVIRKVRRQVGENGFISASVMGPMNLASQLLGVGEFLEMLVCEPELLEKVLDFAAELTVEWGMAEVAAGADLITMGEAICSCKTMGPRHYKEVGAKYHKRVVEEFNRRGQHLHTLHICGPIDNILLDVADSGVASLDIDSPVDFGISRQLLGKRLTMIGNIAPVEIMNSNADRITELCQAVLKEKEGLGMILSSGCNIPAGSPEENIHAIVNAAKTYGIYP